MPTAVDQFTNVAVDFTLLVTIARRRRWQHRRQEHDDRSWRSQLQRRRRPTR
ncbi:MAG: hypothetical protein MZU97_20140 [Bacillus subtilis]|nr:hypothetical protein [Bacillus subtilis]